MPFGLVVSATDSGIRLAWADTSFDEEGFKVERSEAGRKGPFVPIATVPADTETYVDGEVALGKSYCYRVRSFHQWGQSRATGQRGGDVKACASAVLEAPPLPEASAFAPHRPDHLNVTVLELDRVSVTWRDGSRSETAFEIERSVDDDPFQILAITAPNQRHYYDRMVLPNAKYAYRVRATNAAGTSEWTPPKVKIVADAVRKVRVLFDTGVIEIPASFGDVSSRFSIASRVRFLAPSRSSS